jgi:hypothetical protein
MRFLLYEKMCRFFSLQRRREMDMATVSEMIREDKHRLFEMLEILKLEDAELRKGVERLANKIRAGMTKEDIAWVEQKFQS